ncbi:MAG TPA: putative oxidoreductase C-terminal domain-containing protein [Casimicrobiaceae bacterium]|nr:putative oxidoreductase C-terminal domain-containing protein [Casimicrobiaceae bacterium]
MPESYHVGHKAQFRQAMQQFLDADGAPAAWEIPNMLAKCFTTTQARAIAKA